MANQRLAVVIPVHQSAASLRASVAALAASELPRDRWQLIVVDDASADACAVVAAEYADVVVRLPAPRRGAGYARNRGVDVASADVVVFVDPGVCVAPDALSRVLTRFDAEPSLAALCGLVRPSPAASSVVARYALDRQLYVHERCAGETDVFASQFAAVRRQLFVDAGMFDEWRVDVPNTENAELGQRLRMLGARIGIDPELRASMGERLSLQEFLRARLRDRGLPWNPIAVPPAGFTSRRAALRRADGATMVLAWVSLWLAGVAIAGDDVRAWWLAVATAALGAALNAGLFVFLARTEGPLFVLSALPLHLAESLSGGASRAWGWCVRVLIGEPRPDPAIEAYAEVGVATWPPVPTRREPVVPPSLQQ